VLLDAAPIVIKHIPETHFVLVGDGPEREKLEAKAAENGILQRVHFLGFRKRVAPIVKLFDVFALPSTAETFSAATLEAMALAVPTVVTDVGSMSEIVVPGVTGSLVPPHDHVGLADKIVGLLSNSNRAKEMGNAGRERVKKYFTAEREVHELESLFESLLNQRQFK